MQNSLLPQEFLLVHRRKFINDTLKAAGLLALAISPSLAFANALLKDGQYTVQQIIDLILKEGNLIPKKDTVDTLKNGKPEQIVTGIITTMFATITVIEEAIKLNANFIIAHEPTFYNHRDDIDWVKNNKVTAQKQALLDKHKIVIWRFHDYCHSLKPDAVSYGFARKAGWLPYYKSDEQMLTIPGMTLEKLAEYLKNKLGIRYVRFIGDPNQMCARIALFLGAPGGQRQVSLVEKENPDVLITGEAVEWETVEYMRDSNLLGNKPAMLVLGHAASEDPGMEWFAEWLQTKLKEIKIKHIASGDAFHLTMFKKERSGVNYV